MQKNNQTKIIATIGPSCETEEMLEKLFKEGADMARLNFSHGSHNWHNKVITTIRKIEEKISKHIDIIADIQGPKIRIGEMPEIGFELRKGKIIIIDTNATEFNNEIVPLPSSMLYHGTKKGHILFIDDGKIQVEVISKKENILKAKVLHGGILHSKKGINAPDLDIAGSTLNEKDKADIIFAENSGADYIALSFLRNAKDVKEAKNFLAKNSKNKNIVRIIAKIERKEALLNLKEITDEVDAVMVARGDLGIETPLWELPIRQKEIVELVKKEKKPVIIATQMLDSMIRNPIPTRAEVSDVANAVFECADAVMLSGETAFGAFPIEAVTMMKKIINSSSCQQDKSCKNNF